MEHTRGAPHHPVTQGKTERWHQTLKNRILLENYFFPDDLETQIDRLRRELQPFALSREHQQSDPDAGRPSCWNEKGSNATPSQIDACFTEHKLPNITNQMRQMLS